MKKRSIIIYWLLLLVPTFIIGAAAFQMLRHEQERIDQAARFSAQNRARAIAETLQITVADVEDGLTQSLYRIHDESLTKVLSTWEKSNPLIRNVFVYMPKAGLEYPLAGASATSEERRFIERYSALFSGRIAWHSAGVETKGDQMSSIQKVYQEEGRSSLVRDIQKLKTGRQRLLNLTKGRVEDYGSGNLDKKKPPRKTGAWIPWFAENRLFILGWVQRELNGLIYGVELELMTLLSRLVADFPATVPEGMVYALVDDGGQILHQAGKSALKPGARPDLSVSLAPFLPHWQVAVYFIDGHLAAGSDRGFIILTGLLLAIFIIAIILGGSLLTWQAHRNMVDVLKKTSFVSSVSHELKTPLTSIRMYAELLNEGRVKDEEKKKHYLNVIVSESQRLTRLVNNVLDFSRLEQGRKEYHFKELEITGFLGELVEFHRLRVQEAGLVLKEQIPEKDIILWTDRDAIEQVILNLLDNAIKYAAEGEELVIDLKTHNSRCEIRVMDRGPGVLPAHRDNIFKKFHRVDDTLTSPQPGSGLGLSIARRLLRQLDGDLRYEPREGGGSCFVVVLPTRSDR